MRRPVPRRRRPPPLSRTHERCEAECPRCGTHAEEDPLDANLTPTVLGFTAESSARLESAIEIGSRHPIEVEANFHCPRCDVVWSGIVVAEPGRGDA